MSRIFRQNLTSVEYTIVIPFVAEKKLELSDVVKGCSLNDFLSFGVSSSSVNPPPLEFQQVSLFGSFNACYTCLVLGNLFRVIHFCRCSCRLYQKGCPCLPSIVYVGSIRLTMSGPNYYVVADSQFYRLYSFALQSCLSFKVWSCAKEILWMSVCVWTIW